MKKRILSVLLCLCMVVGLLPTTALADEHQHCICGSSTHAEEGHETKTFEAWTSATALPSEANKAYYLTDNVTLSGTWTVPNNTVLCLNGKTITANGDFAAITVGDSVAFTLTDCATTQGKITHTAGANGRGVENNGTFKMYGGNITGNNYNGENYGGGVYNGSTFHLYGGTISGNKVSGSGVYGAGVYNNNGQTFNMYGGTICDNEAGPGSAQYTGKGGGVYNAGTFTMTGGTISGNKALQGGGVITQSLSSTAAFTMSGGEITGNTVKGPVQDGDGAWGGGVAVRTSHGTFTVRGSARVTGNTKIATDRTNKTTVNNVYLQYFTTRTITVDTMTSGAEIGVTSGGGTTLREGNPVIVSNANANNGSYVSYFTSDDPAMALTCNTDNQLQLKMKTTYTVTSSGTSNGSFVVDVKDSESNDRAVADAAVTIVPTPASGYEVGTVTVTGADSSPVSVSNTDNTYTFTMPAQAVTVSVTFRSSTPTTHNVTFAGGDGASGTGPTESSHEAGDSFNLPLPTGHSFTKANYTFIGWSDGTHSYLPGAAYTMPDHDVTLTALWTASNPHAETKVTIAGQELNGTNAYYHNGTRDNLNGTAGNDSNAAGASAYFKAGVLVLNGLNVNNGKIEWKSSAGGETANDDLIIVLLSGSVNTVTNTIGSAVVGDTGMTYGPSLTIRTSGDTPATLYAIGGTNGLWVWQDTTIEGSAKVIAQGGSNPSITTDTFGIATNTNIGKFTLQGNADVKAVGGQYGISGDTNPSHNITMASININGGKLLAQGGTQAMQITPAIDSGITSSSGAYNGQTYWVGTTGTTRATKPTAAFTATSATSGVLSGLTTDMQYKLGYSDWVKITSGMLTGDTITLTDLPSSGLTISVQKTDSIDTTDDDSDVLVLTPCIQLSQTGTYNFETKTTGYTESNLSPLSVTVTNNGSQATGDLTVALSGENATNYFALSTTSLNSIAVGSAVRTFTVRPQTDLSAGTYTATVTVSNGSGISATFNVSFTVAPALDYSISLSADGSALSGSDTVNFGTETVGYDSAPAAKSVTVTNTGTNATGDLTVALSGENATEYFTLSTTSLNSIAVGGHSAPFTVQPKTGLAAGTYTATVTVSGGSGIESKSFNVSFTVNPLGELETVHFSYAYDVQRNPPFPEKNGTIELTRLYYPILADGSYGSQNNGDWTLTRVGTYSYVKSIVVNTTNLESIISKIHQKYTDLNPEAVMIHELKNGAEHIAYGVVVAYDTANGNAVFLGDPLYNGAGYLLATGTRSGTVSAIAGSILTDFIPTAPSGFTLTPNGTYTFPGAIVGYGAQTPLTVTVTNTGSQETGELQVTLGSDKFTLSGLTDGKISSIPATPSSNTATFKVVPNTGLAPGSYIAQVNVSNGSVVQTLTVTFTVTRAATTNTISLSVDGSPLTGTYTFPGATVGYGAQNALEVTVTNTGATATNRLDLRTSGDAGQFELSPITLGSLAPGGATRFTVTPKTGLAANYYTLEIMVYDSRNSEVLATLQVTFTVTSSSGGGGGNYNPSYKVDTQLPDDVDGTVSAKTSTAKKGDTVTITVTPDPYYKVDGVVVKDQNGKALDVTDHGDGTFTFKMPSSKVTVEPIFSWDNPFVDVTENAYYTPAVEWALKNGITGGSTAATFSPDAACTRAQAVTFLWRAAGSPAPKSSAMPFNDVAADAYYYDAVLWAVEQGITAGASDTAFNPNAICTRAQIVTFLWRAEASLAAAIANPFVDVPADAYYADAVSWAVENGITSGTSATTFSPAADCTRAQILMFLYRDVIQ